MRPLLYILLCLAALLGARTAVASGEPEPRVRVINFSVFGGGESTARRVRAELRVADFEVVDVEPPSDLDEGEAWAARQLDGPDALGVALLRVQSDGRAKIRWWQRQPDGTLADRTVAAADDTSESIELIALRVAELATAAASVTLEVEPEPIEPPPGPQRHEPRPPRWRVSVGAGPLWSPGGLGVMLQPTAAGSVALGAARRFGVGADVSVTAVPGRVALEGQRRRIGVARMGVHAVGWLAADRRVSASLALGGGVGVGWSSPSPRRQTAVAMLSIAPAVHIALSTRVGLELGLRGAVALPRFEVASGSTRLATAGQPFVDGWLGVQFRG